LGQDGGGEKRNRALLAGGGALQKHAKKKGATNKIRGTLIGDQQEKEGDAIVKTTTTFRKSDVHLAKRGICRPRSRNPRSSKKNSMGKKIGAEKNAGGERVMRARFPGEKYANRKGRT